MALRGITQQTLDLSVFDLGRLRAFTLLPETAITKQVMCKEFSA